MQQDRNNSRRTGQQNSARRQGKPRKAYDWTQDRRPSNQNRRRTQGYQEQTLACTSAMPSVISSICS